MTSKNIRKLNKCEESSNAFFPINPENMSSTSCYTYSYIYRYTAWNDVNCRCNEAEVNIRFFVLRKTKANLDKSKTVCT